MQFMADVDRKKRWIVVRKIARYNSGHGAMPRHWANVRVIGALQFAIVAIIRQHHSPAIQGLRAMLSPWAA
jgi:hypothetical protein